MTYPDAWDEVCRITIIKDDGVIKEYASFTEDITGLDFGDKEINVKPTTSGGRIKTKVPMTEETVTLKIYPVSASDATDEDGAVQLYHPQSTADSTDPIVVDNSLDRHEFKVCMLWSTKLPASALTPPDLGEAAYRIQIINANMTRYKPDYSDKELSAEVTFKWAPFNKAGTANKREESTEGGARLPTATSSATAF